MIEDIKVQTLLEEFAKNFPEIDFSEVSSPYDQVEELLLPHLDTFTEEQWKVILSREYDKLFQSGSPHYGWNTDRGSIIRKLIVKHSLKPCKTWSETWYNVRKYSLKLPTGVILEIKIEDPISFSGGSRTHYHIKITDEFIPVPTHRAIILSIGSDTRAYMQDQFAGSLNECEDWVARTISPRQFFKIMPIE